MDNLTKANVQGEEGFALQYLLQLYMQTLHYAIRCAFAGLLICRPHSELCALRALFYVWCGPVGCSHCGPLRATAIAGQCKVRALRISVLEGLTLHNLMHFYMQTLSYALLRDWGVLDYILSTMWICRLKTLTRNISKQFLLNYLTPDIKGCIIKVDGLLT